MCSQWAASWRRLCHCVGKCVKTQRGTEWVRVRGVCLSGLKVCMCTGETWVSSRFWVSVFSRVVLFALIPHFMTAAGCWHGLDAGVGWAFFVRSVLQLAHSPHLLLSAFLSSSMLAVFSSLLVQRRILLSEVNTKSKYIALRMRDLLSLTVTV